MGKTKKGGRLKSNTLRSMIKGSGFRQRQGNPEDDSGVELPTLNEHFVFRPRQGPPEDTLNERVAQLEKKYNPEDISLVGHSQSGLIAELLPSKAREIITLNKATRPQDALFRRRKSNQYDIRSR